MSIRGKAAIVGFSKIVLRRSRELLPARVPSKPSWIYWLVSPMVLTLWQTLVRPRQVRFGTLPTHPVMTMPSWELTSRS